MVPQNHLPLCSYSENQCLALLSKALWSKGSLKLQMNLRTFATQIASAFTLAGKDPKRIVGRPRRSISPKPLVGRNPAIPSSVADIQIEKTAHWFEIDGNRSCCRKCNITCTVKCSKCKVRLCNITCTVKCSKCKVRLCLSKERNSFKDFQN